MTMLVQSRQETAAARRLSGDALTVYALFAVTVFLLVASAITGWRAAANAPATVDLPVAGPASPGAA
jgi:Mg2+/Co2+ transporter CorB